MVFEILKTLSDGNRLRILNLLSMKELCVSELELLLGVHQSNLSRHLKNMTELGLLESHRENKYIYYKVNKEFINRNPFIKELQKCLIKEKTMKEDFERCRSYIEKQIPSDCTTNRILKKSVRKIKIIKGTHHNGVGV